MSKAEFQLSVDIVLPEPIETSGKIYAYRDYIFVNDKFRGVHVIDNRDPYQPRPMAFIKIPGNVDISVKDDYLYADSLRDLVVIDISNIEEIRLVNRLQDVLHDNVVWPAEADIFEYGDFDYENDVLLGWEVVSEMRDPEEVSNRFGGPDIALAEAFDSGTTGQGGSLARFKIVADYLYAVDSHFINVFDISNLESPKVLEDVYAGFDIETIFNQGNYLFLGSMRGMYIYDISSPAAPEFVSEFQHGTACDPVVVDGDYAFVTLRGGNNCGALESGLFIVDISNIENPVLLETYPMEEPYGLGIRGDHIYVCDGAAGLKVYDKGNISELIPVDHISDVYPYDVIPTAQRLLMVGKEELYQYEYLADGLQQISVLRLE